MTWQQYDLLLPDTGEDVTAADVPAVLGDRPLPSIAPRRRDRGAVRLRPHSTGGWPTVDRAASEP